jgi:DNA replication and repair protein RecF
MTAAGRAIGMEGSNSVPVSGVKACPRCEVSRVVVRDFRNLSAVDVEIPADGVVLIGGNGAGKTNFLEVIRYFTVLRAARAAHDSELVRHGEESFFISGSARAGNELKITVGYDRATKLKKVSVDGVVAGRLSDAFGSIAAALVSPSDVALISGGPAERRRYLDVLLSLIDTRYLAALQKYRAALMRRNAALREVARGVADELLVAAWEPLLATSGALLWRRRSEWCEEAAIQITQLCSLMGEEGLITLELIRGGLALPRQPEAEELLRALEVQRSTDLRRGSTSVGPHRDDLRILLDGHDLRAFGSGGQQHTAALALRFLENFSLRDSHNRWPVLLLDDPFAELDARRADRIRQLVKDSGHGQVVLAVPREDDVPEEFMRLERCRVRGGDITTGGR